MSARPRPRPRPLLAALAAAVALLAPGCGGEEPAPDPPRAGDPGTRFGFSENFVAGTGEIAQMAAPGADLARRRLSWTEIEPRRGGFDWSRYDAIYDEVLANRMRPLWMLVDAPCWTHSDDPGCAPNVPARAPGVDDAEDLAAFLAEVTRRYPESLGIEVGNEVNDERFWAGGLNPNDYAYLLRVAAEAVHGENPEMPVVAAGLAPFDKAAPGRLPWRVFARAMINSGAADEIDAFAFHPYPPGPSEQTAEAVEREQAGFEDWLEREGYGDVPVWVTEIGVTTVGPNARAPDEQALELAEILERLEARGTPVVALHRLQDEVIAGDPLEAGFGVIEADGVTAKPAYCAIAAVREAPCP